MRPPLETSLFLTTLTAFLLLLASHPALAAGEAELELEIAAGDTGMVKFPIRNGCASTHKFKIEAKKLPGLSFAEKGSPIPVGPGQTHTVELRFDTTRRPPGVYDGTLLFGCKDCKKDKRCHVENKKLSLRLTITEGLDPALLARRLREIEARFQAARPTARTPGAADLLVGRTEQELATVFDEVDRGGELGPLEDWAQEELQQVRRELEALGSTTARETRLPHPVAMLAALTPAAVRTAAGGAAPETRVESLLERVRLTLAELIDRLESNDLTVDLTIASAPEQGAWFQLFRVHGSEPTAQRPTDGVLEKVRRGLYRYRVDHAGHEPIEARLDLVRDDRPLCCRLDEGVCYPLSQTEACHGAQGH
jgi:hypothetical protein